MKITKYLLWASIMVLFLSACQYEEGPNLSLYSKGKRVQGRWYFSQVKYNDVDSTEHYRNGQIEFSLGEGSGHDWGLFTWITDPTISRADGMKIGGWSFIADKDSIELVFLAEHQALYDTVAWKIKRLAYDEWWMERQYNDTTILRWELWKWVF